MHKNVEDSTGKRFGRLVALEYVGKRKWRCQCDCGNETIVRGTYLRSGHTVSCGCFRTEKTIARSMTHGLTGSKAHRAWTHMKNRCLNSNYHANEEYRDRGICDRWLDSFEAFYEDMGEPPTQKHTLERINNDGPYSPENCRWATQAEQNRNTNQTLKLTYNGITRPLIDWAEAIGLPYGTLRARIKRGWSTKNAIETPLIKEYSHPTS